MQHSYGNWPILVTPTDQVYLQVTDAYVTQSHKLSTPPTASFYGYFNKFQQNFNQRPSDKHRICIKIQELTELSELH